MISLKTFLTKQTLILPFVLGILVTMGCTDNSSASYSRGVYLLLDTSGTYTQELNKAKQLINYMLAILEPGDSFTVARIDSGSFSEKDIIAKVVLDARPSASNKQKRDFASKIDQFVTSVQSSPYTDISGGLLQAVEYLNEANVGKKTIMIYSDLKEDLPKGYIREFELSMNGFEVHALNVTKLRADNRNPQEYLDRVSEWESKIITGGGSWNLINDLDNPEAIVF